MSVGMIDTSRIEAMVAQLKTAAARANPASDNPLQAKEAAGAVNFQSALKSSIDQVNKVQLQAQDMAQRFEMGDSIREPVRCHALVAEVHHRFPADGPGAQQAGSAYQEIMNMGV